MQINKNLGAIHTLLFLYMAIGERGCHEAKLLNCDVTTANAPGRSKIGL